MSLFRISPKTIVLGGIAIAAAAGALKNRDRVAGLIGARSSAPEPPRPEPRPEPVATETRPPATPEAPASSNYDVGGPVANTATAVPAPDALVLDDDGGIDERAEEAAAAAEAAAIGGGMPEYAGIAMDEQADEATRPLMEAGEGESEGMEQAESDLVDEAEPRSGATSDAERRIDAIIEQSGNPTTGESIEAVDTNAPDVTSRDERIGAATADDADDAPRSSSADDDRANRGVPTDEPLGGASGVMPRPDLSTPEGAGGEDAPFIHPDQTSLLGEEEAPSRETPAAEKSSAVWQPPARPEAPAEDEERREEGGSGWQTWSGRPSE